MEEGVTDGLRPAIAPGFHDHVIPGAISCPTTPPNFIIGLAATVVPVAAVQDVVEVMLAVKGGVLHEIVVVPDPVFA